MVKMLIFGHYPNHMRPGGNMMIPLLRELHYYPFGSVMQGRAYSSTAYRYGFNGKEKEADGTADHYDFGARIYDGRLGRWLSRDAKSKETPYNTPYCGFLNDPIIFIDPTGNTDVYFDKSGKVKEIKDDNGWHTFWHGTRGYYENEKGENVKFRFNDPKNDKAQIRAGIITRLIMVKPSEVQKMYTDAGVFDKTLIESSLTDKIKWFKSHGSGMNGVLDFSYTAIPQMYPGTSFTPLKNPSDAVFIADGGSGVKAYNHMDFGNFLVGGVGGYLGIPKTIVKFGGHWNALRNPNGYKSQFDSAEDQQAIDDGWFYGKYKPWRAEEKGKPTVTPGPVEVITN
jgi:RHS repeat-associated protein